MKYYALKITKSQNAYFLHTQKTGCAYFLQSAKIRQHTKCSICLPKINSQMNQCIITIIEKSVLVTFVEVVKKGSIEVWSIVGKSTSVYTKEIQHTNFENLPLNLGKGKYRIEILMDGQQITKTININ